MMSSSADRLNIMPFHRGPWTQGEAQYTGGALACYTCSTYVSRNNSIDLGSASVTKAICVTASDCGSCGAT